MTADGDGWSIGELAERAGAGVKTVRFYSDSGLLPEAARSGGGHRRYGPEALERLRLIRALRAMELPLPAVAEALDDPDRLPALLDARRREVGEQLAALRWREAALEAVRTAAPYEQAERLLELSVLGSPPSTDRLVHFWRRRLPVRLPTALVRAIVDAGVPELPPDPTPAQALALARLLTLTGQPLPPPPSGPCFSATLYLEVGEAYDLAAAGADEAVDAFVLAHARAWGKPVDTRFRGRLRRKLVSAPDLLMDRYWALVAEAATRTGRPTMGESHDRIVAAL